MLEKPSEKYPQQKYRYVIFVLYILAALVNSLPVHTFSSINVIIEEKFQISAIQVTLNALLFTIAHPLFSVPCNWLLNKYGMHISFVVGAIFVSAGVWLRLLLEVGEPFYCLLGSLLAAIGNIFILNTPSKVALNWFGQQRVNIVTFTGILATLLSITAGASVPGFIINQESSEEDIHFFLLIQAIVVTVPMVLLAIFFRQKPEHAPSKAAKVIFNQERTKYKDLLKSLFKNKQYLKLMLAMTFNYGTLTSLIMILDQFLAGLQYKKSGQVTSITIACAMTVGIISNPIFSLLIRKTKAYRGVAALSTLGSFILTSLLILGFTFKITSDYEIGVLGGLAGMFLVPVPSILITYSSQIVFPLDESSSAGYLFASSQTFGFCFGLLSISLLDKTSPDRSKIVGAMNASLLLISFFMAIWVKQDLKKWKFETQSQMNTNQSHSRLQASLIVKQEGLK